MSVFDERDYLGHVPAVSRRRPGPIASLAAVILNYRPRSRGSPEGVPNWLRQDVGLPPIGDLPDYWERL